MQIKFETALVTGSSRGLGRQIAAKPATEGVKKIAIHCRTGRSDAETTLSAIEAAGAPGYMSGRSTQWLPNSTSYRLS